MGDVATAVEPRADVKARLESLEKQKAATDRYNAGVAAAKETKYAEQIAAYEKKRAARAAAKEGKTVTEMARANANANVTPPPAPAMASEPPAAD